MFKLTDDMIIQLLGKDLYDYCVAKSIVVAGGPFFDVILLAALGKMVDDGILKVTIKLPIL